MCAVCFHADIVSHRCGCAYTYVVHIFMNIPCRPSWPHSTIIEFMGAHRSPDCLFLFALWGNYILHMWIWHLRDPWHTIFTTTSHVFPHVFFYTIGLEWKADHFSFLSRWHTPTPQPRWWWCAVFYPSIGSSSLKSQLPSHSTTAIQRLTKQTCLETDGVRERVGTVWDELHICRSQGDGPQTIGDYTVEKRESVRIWVQL